MDEVFYIHINERNILNHIAAGQVKRYIYAARSVHNQVNMTADGIFIQGINNMCLRTATAVNDFVHDFLKRIKIAAGQK